jgi:hypothetical protein
MYIYRENLLKHKKNLYSFHRVQLVHYTYMFHTILTTKSDCFSKSY